MVVCGLKVTVLCGRGGCAMMGVGGGSNGEDSSASEGIVYNSEEREARCLHNPYPGCV